MKTQSNIQKLVESRWQKIQEQRDTLVKDWDVFISATDEYMKNNRGSGLSVMEKHNIAVCLENALCKANSDSNSGLFETTDSSSVAFLGVNEMLCAA